MLLLAAPPSRLDSLDKDKRLQRLPDIINAADAVIAAVDTQALAVFLAMRPPDDSAAGPSSTAAPSAAAAPAAGGGASAPSTGATDADAAAGGAGSAAGAAAAAAPSYKQRKKAMDEAKAALLEALSKKVQAQLDSGKEAAEGAGSGGAAAAGATSARATFAELRQWVDTAADTAYALLHARVEASSGRWVACMLVLHAPQKQQCCHCYECTKGCLSSSAVHRIPWHRVEEG